MKKLAGATNPTVDTVNTTITQIKFSTAGAGQYSRMKEEAVTPSNINSNTTYVDISSEYSPLPIYIWMESGTIYWFSEILRPSLPVNCASMFNGLTGLTEIEGFKELNPGEQRYAYFDTDGIGDASKMFYNCSSLQKLDLTMWETGNLRTMREMFYGCSSLVTVDLSSFNTRLVNSMYKMFTNCSSLTTIYASSNFVTTNLYNIQLEGQPTGHTDSTYLFNNCLVLEGGQGTHYSSSHVNADYAHVDGGTSNPGYFTEYVCYSIGDEVRIGTGSKAQEFYVLEASGKDQSTVTLLAKYNLSTTANSSGHYLQAPNAAISATACAFSSKNYWSSDWVSGTSMDLNTYTTASVASANSQNKDNNAIMKARDYATAAGGTNGRLLTYEEANTLLTRYD